MRYLSWLYKVAKPYGFSLFAVLLCHILVTLCTLGFVYSSKGLVDAAVAILNGGKSETFNFYAILFASILIIRIVMNVIRSYIQSLTEIKIKNNLRKRLFDILLHFQDDGGRKHHSGDVLNRMQEDVRIISATIANSIPNVIGAVLQFLAAFCFLCYLDYRLALIVVVIIPIGIVVGKYISSKIKDLTLNIRSSDSKVQSHIQESIQHLPLIQSLEYAETSSSTLKGLQDNLYENEFRRTRFSLLSRFFISVGFSLSYILAFLWGAYGISVGTMTYGMMTAFLQLVAQIQRPLSDLSSSLPAIIHTSASIDRITDLEALPISGRNERKLLKGVAGVRFSGVSFGFPDSNSDIYTDFSYEFRPGSRTAVMGPTGVGKSTMIRLLLSLLQPRSGKIELYNEDGECVDVSASARSNLIYVPQGNSLFSGTVLENLLMGKPDAKESEIRWAISTAAADFVYDLPDGVYTQCFEAGGGLSEGQAQRIAIARALLRPGSILLLDEFSSALDIETETRLIESLTKELSGKTMIFITHREKIVDYCDSVLRLGN